MTETISVLVVDDHTLMRQGTMGLLESQPDIEVVGEASSGREGIDVVAKTRPDVVLMDIAMPGLSGLDATREISGRYPDVSVIIVTMHEREDYLFEALRAGASGYLLKGADGHLTSPPIWSDDHAHPKTRDAARRHRHGDECCLGGHGGVRGSRPSR